MDGVWITKPARRLFDVPENGALAWVLRALEERAIIAASALADAPTPWVAEIRDTLASVRRARKVAWLENLPTVWPGDNVYFYLRADRVGFYRTRVAEAARYLRRMLSPTEADIVEALGARYFEPTQDWKLFEIAVLLRICTALEDVGTRLGPTLSFHDRRPRPFATYRLDASRKVRVWYQKWPPSTGPSELDDAIAYYRLPAGGTRPDIVIEVVEEETPLRGLILELKASTASSYMSSGFSQLLGYLRERPTLFMGQAAAWLVVPMSSNFASKPPAGRSLWITSADDVATAVRDSIVRDNTDHVCDAL
jgi:hypothetical protein